MTGEMDPFDFALAAELGMTVDRMRREMPNPEYFAWRAFYTWRKAQLDLAAKEM